MSKIKLSFKNKKYEIDKSLLSSAISNLESAFDKLSGGVTPDTPEVLEGSGSEYYTLAPTALSFRSTAPLSEFQEVQVNGQTVDPSNYTLEEGSTIVKLSIDYLKTLDVSAYDVAVVSANKTVNGNFTVAAPTLNEHGFYYNQPYTSYIDGYGNIVLFYREDNILDFMILDNEYVESGTYTISGDTIINSVSVGDIPTTVSSNGVELECTALGATFKLGDKRCVADDDYVYVYYDHYWSGPDGYVAYCIDKTKASYGAIKTGINEYPTVAMHWEGFSFNINLEVMPEIPSTINRMPSFEGCTSLTNVVIPDSITEIGSTKFQDCIGLTSVIIPNGVTEIGSSAFNNCTSLESIIIPASITTLYSSIFCNCTSLSNIAFAGTVEQWNNINKIGNNWTLIGVSHESNTPATHVTCSDGTVAL